MSLPVVPVTTPAAQAAVVYGCVSVSTRLDPWRSGAVEIATRKVIPPGSVGLAQAYLHQQPPRPWESSLPPHLSQLRSTIPIRASVHDHCSAEPKNAIGLHFPSCFFCIGCARSDSDPRAVSSVSMFCLCNRDGAENPFKHAAPAPQHIT